MTAKVPGPPENGSLWFALSFVFLLWARCFGNDKWTHVVVSWEELNTGQIARGKLYFDCKFQVETGGIREPFVWDLTEATIRLGTGPYIGMFEDVAIFNRYLSSEEVHALCELKGGGSDLH